MRRWFVGISKALVNRQPVYGRVEEDGLEEEQKAEWLCQGGTIRPLLGRQPAIVLSFRAPDSPGW
jgi:hypothetical protein